MAQADNAPPRPTPISNIRNHIDDPQLVLSSATSPDQKRKFKPPRTTAKYTGEKLAVKDAGAVTAEAVAVAAAFALGASRCTSKSAVLNVGLLVIASSAPAPADQPHSVCDDAPLKHEAPAVQAYENPLEVKAPVATAGMVRFSFTCAKASP